VNVDQLPETDFSDPDWDATFSRKLKRSLGVSLEAIRRNRLPAHGEWVAIVDPGDSADTDAPLHALVCRDRSVIHDPARRAPKYRDVRSYHLFAGFRLREPGS